MFGEVFPEMFVEVFLRTPMDGGPLVDAGVYSTPHCVTDERALEGAFAAFNGHPTEGWKRAADSWYARGNRSLSVGDRVVVCRPVLDGVLRLAYECAPVGWTRVPSVFPIEMEVGSCE